MITKMITNIFFSCNIKPEVVMGYDEPNYFGSVQAVFRWMLPNCDCGDDEE